jgi:hypothetical protein
MVYKGFMELQYISDNVIWIHAACVICIWGSCTAMSFYATHAIYAFAVLFSVSPQASCTSNSHLHPTPYKHNIHVPWAVCRSLLIRILVWYIRFFLLKYRIFCASHMKFMSFTLLAQFTPLPYSCQNVFQPPGFLFIILTSSLITLLGNSITIFHLVIHCNVIFATHARYAFVVHLYLQTLCATSCMYLILLAVYIA